MEAINLSSLLNFAQYTLSVCPKSFWLADGFLVSQIKIDLSGLAETKNLPSCEKSRDHMPSLY
jgi:hypothetical protein